MTDRHIGNLLISLYAIKSAQQALTAEQSLTCVIDYHLLPLAEYLVPEIRFIPVVIRGRKPSILKKLSLFFRLLVALRGQKFDAAVDLYGHGESYRIAKLSGAKFIASFSCSTKLQSKYHWSSADTSLEPKHQIDYYLYPFIPFLGQLLPASIQAPQLNNVKDAIHEKLRQLKTSSDKPMVAIHPGAGKAYKLWPIQHWQQLIERLEQAGNQVLLIGSGADAEQIELIKQSELIAPIDAYQHFNLIETIHLGFICHLMLGNDSGPTHLMATTQTQVISLFGPSDHTLWSPLSDNAHILHSDKPCLASCLKGNCQREISCLEALRPEQVLQHIASLR